MGNAAAGVTGGGSWFFSEDATQVVLRLHDARGLTLSHGEEVCGVVSSGPDAPDVARLRRDAPAHLSVGAGTILAIEFQAVETAGIIAEVAGGRVLGEIRLPLEHIARRCGGCLYHMWIPLTLPGARTSTGSEASPHLPGTEAYTLEQFDRALKNAARDPRLPMVCLSLCQADLPEAAAENYDFGAEPAQKAFRFHSLLQSHAQHARLLQALYRQCRSANQQRQDHGPDSALDATCRGASAAEAAAAASEGGPGPESSPSGGPWEDVTQLRQEIESTTSEANARINQASDAIRTLKERLNAKQAEHERMRQETDRFRSDAEAMEIENEQIQLQLDRQARETGIADNRADEVRKLRKEVEVLAEQKDALMLIIEDLYGAAGKDTSDGQAGSKSNLGAGSESTEAATQPQQEWTNMLPRPSELFGTGILDQPEPRFPGGT